MRTVFCRCFDFKGLPRPRGRRNELRRRARTVGENSFQVCDADTSRGRMRAPAGKNPPHYRAVTLSFDDAAAAADAMRNSPVAKPLAADGREHMVNLRWLGMDSEIIVPFEVKKAGLGFLLMAAEFDLHVEKAGFKDAASAEARYLGEHTRIARRLPGLRHYMVGRLVEAAGRHPDRSRMALLAFDDEAALREAYRSAVGAELIKDEEATIAQARVYRIAGDGPD